MEELSYTVLVPQTAFGENNTLFKYREVNQRSLCSLILNQVWLSRPEDFNDPFEVSARFDGALFTGTSRERLEREVREAGVLCLCASAENLAMWSYYGNGLRGFAVGYDLKLLLDKLAPVQREESECTTRWRYVHRVEYRADLPDAIDENALVYGDHKTQVVEWQKMFGTKSTTFEHELECRIVVRPSADRDPPYRWPGHGLYQHDPAAINQIVLGELIPEQDEAAIRSIMTGRNVTFLRATRVEGEFRLELKDAA